MRLHPESTPNIRTKFPFERFGSFAGKCSFAYFHRRKNAFSLAQLQGEALEFDSKPLAFEPWSVESPCVQIASLTRAGKNFLFLSPPGLARSRFWHRSMVTFLRFGHCDSAKGKCSMALCPDKHVIVDCLTVSFWRCIVDGKWGSWSWACRPSGIQRQNVPRLLRRTASKSRNIRRSTWNSKKTSMLHSQTVLILHSYLSVYNTQKISQKNVGQIYSPYWKQIWKYIIYIGNHGSISRK